MQNMNKRSSLIHMSSSTSSPPESSIPVTISGENANIKNEVKKLSSISEIKSRLIEIIPRCTGKREELETISVLVNALEEKYTPMLTLDFLNLAMEGDWQLLFTTNQLGIPLRNLRLRELYQRIEPNIASGRILNVAQWDLAENEPSNFDCTGTFTVQCSYKINPTGRIILSLENHILKPIGYNLPSDVPKLVSMLFKSMPNELFDPNQLGMDTTFLDENLRIVRMTGGGETFEGVRNIFIRKGVVAIDPTAVSGSSD